MDMHHRDTREREEAQRRLDVLPGSLEVIWQLAANWPH